MSSAILDCTRSEAFWFQDGNIILHVQVADVVFRVHRSVLSTHSTVFKDMFGTPEPEDEVLYEGCRVVPVWGDLLEDWENVLTCIYKPMRLNPSLKTIKVEQIISMLRLGKKYQFDEMFNSCIDRLRQELPQTLQDFESVSCVVKKMPEYEGPLTHMADLFILINFAVEMEMEVLLPAAYYTAACEVPVKSIFRGLQTRDETRTVTLCTAAQEAIFRGKEEMHRPVFRWYFERHHGFASGPYEPDVTCRDKTTGKTTCAGGFKWSRECIQNILSQEPLPFALSPCIETQIWSDIFMGMCYTCYVKERRLRDDHRRKLWQELPITFGLEKRWEELTFYRL